MHKLALLFLSILLFKNVAYGEEFNSDVYDSVEEETLVERLQDEDPESKSFQELKEEYLKLTTKREKRQFRRKQSRKDRVMLRKVNNRWTGPRLVCVFAGGAAVLNLQVMDCKADDGDKYSVSLIGVGVGANLSTGFAVIKTRDYDPTGSFGYYSSGGYFGVGIQAGWATNEERLALWGFGLGLGWDMSINLITVSKVLKNK